MNASVHIPDTLYAAAQARAAAEGRTLAALIEDGLRQVLATEPVSARDAEASLPMSRHVGGLRVGAELLRVGDADDDLAEAERSARGER